MNRGLRRLVAVVLFFPLACRAPVATVPSLGDSEAELAIENAWRHAADRLRGPAVTLDPKNGFPRSTAGDGRWEIRPVSQWTSGFFPGSLWLMYQHTKDPEWKALAEKWTWQGNLATAARRTNTHDIGFLIHDSFGNGYLLTGEQRYRNVIIDGSKSLVTRYNPRVKAIKSWDLEGFPAPRGQWRYPVIVDNLMNLEMLFWASKNGGDAGWSRIAETHALTSVKAHIRPDGSTGHVAVFHPTTGALLGLHTWQGFADSSTWARGQAWAIHGLATSFQHTRNPTLLNAAQRVADWFIEHLPADGVPYWDFNHPQIPNTERDASAAAIAASGLFDLARSVDAGNAARYLAAADRIVLSLARNYLTGGTSNAAILAHATGQRPQGAEIDVGLVYADYYFLEALLRRRGAFIE
jgi:unsaturated chondroitin disaccharide hydrolase